ncbi:MAG TPA: nicotinate phosphoribosyltransferase, partial [Candidatus Glassbacteria bacterium]|nr:nicotinate phosphoribosyltransferase [Candidatus Glassbacteria bacterium]
MDKLPKLERLQDIARVSADDGRRLFSATHQEIFAAHVTDVYFLKTLHLLKAEALDRTPVVADIHSSAPGIFVGAEEVRRLLVGAEVKVRALKDGDRMALGETVMQIEAPYGEFCLHETALLGIISSSSGWATAAAACVDAAGGAPVACFASRHLHPAVAPVMERASVIAGCASASNLLGARLAGLAPTGTIPHSLVLIVGDTLAASELYLKHLAEAGPLVSLVDTFMDEAWEAVRVAGALGDKLYGVRLDTPGERGGVTPALVREVRARLNQAGAANVKILISGGITPAKIPPLLEAGADAFGVGSYISDANPIDMTLDLKQINGKPVAKRGRIPGPAVNPRL